MAIEALKQLTHAALQNDKMTLSDVAQVYNATSLADLRQGLKQAEAEAEERAQAMQQQDQAMQQQAMQSQKEAEQFTMQLEQEKLKLAQEKEVREDARNTEDNNTKLRIAEMNILAKAADTDVNDNGIRDSIDMAKLNLEQSKMEMSREDNAAKRELEREKMKSKEILEREKMRKNNNKI